MSQEDLPESTRDAIREAMAARVAAFGAQSLDPVTWTNRANAERGEAIADILAAQQAPRRDES